MNGTAGELTATSSWNNFDHDQNVIHTPPEKQNAGVRFP
jgi:hypothetical protein